MSTFPLDENERRLALGRTIAARKQAELGGSLLAVALYGSVAHHAAREYSDVEIILLTDDETPALEERFFEQGIMVECDRLPATRMIAAASRVDPEWGIEADQYRHHLVLVDPERLFPQVWAAALNIAEEAFAAPLARSWWWAYELLGKLRNAVGLGDDAQTRYIGWRYAYAVALRIALYEHQPYESLRTLWGDVTTRGYGMRELTATLSGAPLAEVEVSALAVWEQTCAWGEPTNQIV
ncbi:MAG TPA: hypothetical protein VKQ36_05585 [Ktedonobacterales bacterium]|nr:hypothetical protein [Ktedonobacterales bacterium]